MTLNEFRDLRKAAQCQLGCEVIVALHPDGWRVYRKDRGELDVRAGTTDEAVAKLREWAMPPRPEMVTISVPFAWAEVRVKDFAGGIASNESEAVTTACKYAIAPYMTPK